VIDTEQLAAALERLSARDREMLDFSLRRRVPDEALAKLYDWDPAEVARFRARAIERLADDLGVQRGEDLGQILKALLEPSTWAAAEAKRSVPEAPAVAPEGPAVVPEEAAEPERPEEAAEPARPESPAEPAPAPAAPPARAGSSARLIAGAIVAAAILVAAGVVWAAGFADDGGSGGDGKSPSQTRSFVPQGSGPLANPFPSDPRSAENTYATAFVRSPTFLYDEPGGKRKLKLSVRTEWGSPRVLGVVRQRAGWLAVQAPELRNSEVGWIPAEAARLGAVTWSLRADTSKRRLRVDHDGKTVRTLRIAVGRSGNPTPVGRFSVTDKLRVSDGGSPYGCCVLALSGHQTHLPKAWPGGDRLAVHATTDTSTIGKAVSLGCMRITSEEARWLIRVVPLGTPLFVER
jgi:L,D-transpeptidase-like protein